MYTLLKSSLLWGRSKLNQLHAYLDNEIAYLDSFNYYVDQIPLSKLPMFYKTFDLDTNITPLIDLPADALAEVFSVSRKISEDTLGVVLEEDNLEDINLFIAQMNKAQIKNRRTNFFVITDSVDILLHLYNVFNWMNKKSYVVPTVYNENIDDSLRPSILYHCLTQLDKCIVNPKNIYLPLLKKEKGLKVSSPPQKAFCFNCKSIVPHER